MASQKPISAEQLARFREQLREMRDRLVNQVANGIDAIRGEMHPAGDLSHVPLHLADAADGQSDADIDVVENERNLLQDVQEALHRIDHGDFGKCLECGSRITAARLRVIPYTPYCIACANQQTVGSASTQSRERGTIKLTGFEAIEFAEQEGLKLNKAGDSIDAAARGLSIAKAEAIASEDPELIWLEIARDEYRVRKNMRPGR